MFTYVLRRDCAILFSYSGPRTSLLFKGRLLLTISYWPTWSWRKKCVTSSPSTAKFIFLPAPTPIPGADLGWNRGDVPLDSLFAPPPLLQIQKVADRSGVISEVPKCSKMQILRGSASDPTGRANSAPPDLLADGKGARCSLPKNPTPLEALWASFLQVSGSNLLMIDFKCRPIWSSYFFRLFVEYFCCTASPVEICGSGPWSAEYCGSAKGMRIFRRRKVAGATSSEL